MTPPYLQLAPQSRFASFAPDQSTFQARYGWELGLVFVAYLLGGRLGLAVPFTSGNVSPVWPAAGIAMAALLLVGHRVWPAIAAAAFLVNFFTPVPALAALGIAIGNTAGPVAGAWLVQRIPDFRPSLTRLTDALGLILIAAPVGAAISACVGVTVLFATGGAPWITFGRATTVWWLGDLTGVLIFTPVLLTLSVNRIETARQAAELAALLASVAVTSLLMFHPSAGVQSGIVLAAAVTPFVLWGAIRFEMRGAASVVFVVCCVAVWQTGLGFGPFLRSTASHNAELLQAFLAMTSVPGLALAAAIAERSQLIRERARREGVAESDRKHRRIIETANDGIWMLDDSLATIFANERLGSLLRYRVSEMLGRSLFDFVFDEDSRRTADDLQRPREADSERIRGRYRRQDGSELWALVSHTPTFDQGGAFTGVLMMVSDITDHKRAEQDRERARQTVSLLSQAVEQTADSVIVTDSSGRILYVNGAFETTTGYTREEALGRTPRLLKSGEHDEAFYRRMWDRLLAGEPFRGSLVNARKNGERYWAEQTITPIRDASGITHFVSVLKDMTAARKNQEQQIQLQLARDVQQRFYTAAVHVPGFDIAASAYPAEQTGGDYFDFIETRDGRCYVAIGDVSGHGLDAALVMAMTRAYVRSFAALGLEVAEILARVNQVLVADLQDGRFVTLLLARLDPIGRTLEYASAGHTPGFLLNRAGGFEAVIDSTGVPLGLFGDCVFAARRFNLDVGHMVVLSTDGVSETRTVTDVEFGDEGVLAYVRGHLHDGSRDIADGIYLAARSFAKGEVQADDMTCVIVKVSEAVQPRVS